MHCAHEKKATTKKMRVARERKQERGRGGEGEGGGGKRIHCTTIEETCTR